MQDYQSLALGYVEELSDLKRRHASLERHCRGLESKLSKTRDRMKMYRARCKAWESALAKVDEIYWGFLGSDELMAPHGAYAAAVCAANNAAYTSSLVMKNFTNAITAATATIAFASHMAYLTYLFIRAPFLLGCCCVLLEKRWATRFFEPKMGIYLRFIGWMLPKGVALRL